MNGCSGLELTALVGQLLVVGFAGTSLPGEIATALRQGELGGVILFRRNLPDVATFLALTNHIAFESVPGLPPFIGIDEEGGRVTRIPDGLPRLPAMRTVAETADIACVRELSGALGKLLASLGINLNFAPVLDVDTNPENPVIGDRSFGRDPDKVSELGVGFAKGMLESNVLPCGKHFPGHGDTSCDSHVDLPQVLHSEERLRKVELRPFREAILAHIPALMTAHVVYRAWEPGIPATLSERINQTILRDELGFSGVLFSDDLEMRALADRMPVEATAVRAVRAGCDVILICHHLLAQERARAALIRECEQDPAFRARCLAAATRSLTLRQQFPPRPLGKDRVLGAAHTLSALLSRTA